MRWTRQSNFPAIGNAGNPGSAEQRRTASRIPAPCGVAANEVGPHVDVLHRRIDSPARTPDTDSLKQPLGQVIGQRYVAESEKIGILNPKAGNSPDPGIKS